jgi:hypothetical protein
MTLVFYGTEQFLKRRDNETDHKNDKPTREFLMLLRNILYRVTAEIAPLHSCVFLDCAYKCIQLYKILYA